MKHKRRRPVPYAVLLPLCLSVTLPGCVSRDISGLENQVAEILARPGGRIEPLPEIKPYQAYSYQSSGQNLDSPFKLFYVLDIPEIAGQAVVDDGLTDEMAREVRERNREELEQFELDSLRMVGTLENEANDWAIVLDPSGVVHRVQQGNYMGKNIGKVINIFEDRIELREIIQGSDGRWAEREAALALIELIE